ncbi:Rieske 2Fe-2S domain-containing protein [Gordonia sp. PDNC005]|uniref:Rieske 2Fe-2S domain-containing protein n=1 Tax=unclassified Gordonia (in: high G+C Gram-positive bacteria) TaxID=2657482 RepID=UPI0019659AFD|nr:Rieske 2Fe-2S domain-containing protein [Gordonia sp. PDNC005]QRY61164.1 Rieske 2Fe-2S domain-containing protein [Gordonia sp. PDNC005]
MAFELVTTLDDLWEGDMESFTVGGKEILIVVLDGGEVVATQAICPHQQVELVEGELDGEKLTCRLHLWQFDLTTCKGLNPTHAELAKFPVEVRGEEIYVDPTGDDPKVAHS